MKLSDLVQVNAHTRTKKYYEELGYKEEEGFFFVRPDDLQLHSSAQETRICDCCGTKFTRRHEYHETTFQRFGKDLCGDCVKTNSEYRNIIQTKKDNTWNEKYGCHPMKVEEIKNKVQQTCNEKYGGHPMHNSEIKEKWLEDVNEKFGGNSPLCKQEVRDKALRTMSNNGDIPTSSQQIEIFKMLSNQYKNCYLNYPEGNFALDILLQKDGMKIDIEYDGYYWHQDEQKDRRRDEVLKIRGYKILRIKAKHKIPSIEQINEGIEYLNNHSYSQITLE